MDVLYLFHCYRDDVYRLAVNYTHSAQEAEDVCQTVFLKLLENPDIMPGKERSWLMQVTANTCRDLLRSAWWKRTVPLETAACLHQPETDETVRLLYKLPPKYRVVLYLHHPGNCQIAADSHGDSFHPAAPGQGTAEDDAEGGLMDGKTVNESL